MLRYKTETRPGLVALYDIQPGNGAGQFLQPRSPHGACVVHDTLHVDWRKMCTPSIPAVTADKGVFTCGIRAGGGDTRATPALAMQCHATDVAGARVSETQSPGIFINLMHVIKNLTVANDS